jgi:hypothetical protein
VELNGESLTIHGLEFDKISSSSGISPSQRKLRHDEQRILDFWTDLIEPLRSYPNGHGLVTAFCSTLVAGKDWYGEPVTDPTPLLTDFCDFLDKTDKREESVLKDRLRELSEHVYPNHSAASSSA